MGDLGIEVAGPDGRAKFRLVNALVEVWGMIGRSVVVASGADDLGLGAVWQALLLGIVGRGWLVG